METDYQATKKCNFEYGKDFSQMYVRWALEKNNPYLNDINYG